MKILFVNACCRGKASRTLRLAGKVLNEWQRMQPEAEVIVHDLYAQPFPSIDGTLLSEREALCEARDWSHVLTRPAAEFQQAELLLIAAPYWDLSFPAALKLWVENMWVRSLTFVYRHDLPVGLCRGKACVYVTTSGSPIGKADFGTDYIRHVMQTLGIPGFFRVSAEGLDIDGADVDALMHQSEAQALQAAQTAWSLLRTD